MGGGGIQAVNQGKFLQPCLDFVVLHAVTVAIDPQNQ
jgi:hypothetical protein